MEDTRPWLHSAPMCRRTSCAGPRACPRFMRMHTASMSTRASALVFLGRDYDFGKHVVHGHTPLRTGQPDQRPFRTNLDTGAVFGSALTAGVFTDEQTHAVEFLQACESRSSNGARWQSVS